MPPHLKTFAFIDLIIIALCLAGSLAFWPLFSSGQPANAVVFRDNNRIAVYPLNSDRDFSVQGLLGPVVISINSGTVRVKESNCPRHICIQAGRIQNQGQQIVCAPNHILIELETSSGKAPDAVTQ
jgi:hypothetical protein